MITICKREKLDWDEYDELHTGYTDNLRVQRLYKDNILMCERWYTSTLVVVYEYVRDVNFKNTLK